MSEIARLICLSLLLISRVQAQGPLDGFLKGKNALVLAPSLSFSSARLFEGAGGNTYPIPYKGTAIAVFGEYGVTDKLDLVGTGAFIVTNSQSGLQDGGVFAKYRLWYPTTRYGKIGLLIGGGVTFPLTNYEALIEGALGQKAVTLPGKCILQWESPRGLFVNLTAGYHARIDKLPADDIEAFRKKFPTYQPQQPADFSTYLVKTGFASSHLYGDAWIEIQKAHGGANYTPNLPELPQTFGISYVQTGGTLYYTENRRWGVSISAGYILKGANISRISRLSLGIIWNKFN